MIVTQATQNTRFLAYFSAFPGSQNPAGAAAQDLSEVAGRPRGGRGKPPFGYLLAPRTIHRHYGSHGRLTVATETVHT